MSKETLLLGSSQYNTVIHAAGKAHSIPNSKDAGANHVIEITAPSTAGTTEAIQIAIVDKDISIIGGQWSGE